MPHRKKEKSGKNGILRTSEEERFLHIILTLPDAIREKLEQTYHFARRCHAGQTRISGEAYIMHPVQIALDLYQKTGDTILMQAALLHDVVEDCAEVSLAEVYDLFGGEVGFIVDALTKTETSFLHARDQIFSDKIERLVYAGLQDVRVLLVKIADRAHNLSQLSNLKDHKQVRMAFESQAIFMPLRTILQYDRIADVDQARENLQAYLQQHHLTSAHELTENLIRQSFASFDRQLFGMIYAANADITWEVTDYHLFCQLTDAPDAADKIQIISMSGNAEWFSGLFRFKRGMVFSGSNLKLSMASRQIHHFTMPKDAKSL